MSRKVTLLYDIELHAPACVLLQAAAGCDRGMEFSLFDSRHWITHPTPGMRLIAGTTAEWERAAAITQARYGDHPVLP
jgi:hypothetical protein